MTAMIVVWSVVFQECHELTAREDGVKIENVLNNRRRDIQRFVFKKVLATTILWKSLHLQ